MTVNYDKLINILTQNNSTVPIYDFMKETPNHDYNALLEYALLYTNLDAAKIILRYHNKNTVEFWNNLMVNAAITDNIDTIKYCLKEGANNLAECFYAAKNYKNDHIANYFIELNINKFMDYNKETVNSFYEKNQHNLIYYFFEN